MLREACHGIFGYVATQDQKESCAIVQTALPKRRLAMGGSAEQADAISEKAVLCEIMFC